MTPKEMQNQITALTESVDTLQTGQSWLRQAVDQIRTEVEQVRETYVPREEAIREFDKIQKETILVLGSRLEEQAVMIKAMHDALESLTAKVEGRNKSAPVKRNMTDADAESVLIGEYKEMPHKEAAEAIGLTYAQVYSCRLEFTFKHVHKDLKDNKQFVNPWSK